MRSFVDVTLVLIFGSGGGGERRVGEWVGGGGVYWEY